MEEMTPFTRAYIHKRSRVDQRQLKCSFFPNPLKKLLDVPCCPNLLINIDNAQCLGLRPRLSCSYQTECVFRQTWLHREIAPPRDNEAKTTYRASYKETRFREPLHNDGRPSPSRSWVDIHHQEHDEIRRPEVDCLSLT